MDNETAVRSGSELELIAISTGSRPYADADRPYPEEVDGTGSWYYPFDRRKLRPEKYYFKPLNSPTFQEYFMPVAFGMFVRKSPDTYLEETRRQIDGDIDVGPFARRCVSIADTAQSHSFERIEPQTTGESQPTGETEKYHYYSVLWVETVDGIMYRKAAGRVPKEIWEQNCEEPEGIVLG